MRLVIRVFFILMLLLFLLMTGGLLYISLFLPKIRPAPAIKIQATPQLLERGEYLTRHVAACIDCHSTRDYSLYAGPLVPGTEGKGGARFGHELGLPGDLYARNITPGGLRDWTDGEVLRAVVDGVSKAGKPYFPFMPYPNYSTMSEEDSHSIVAYIRTLPAIDNKVPESKLDFPMNIIVRVIPRPARPGQRPPASDEVATGKYLLGMAACAECHTPMRHGTPLDGMDFAGGFEFPFPDGVARSTNITPDPETGIGAWDREAFVKKFKVFADPERQAVPVEKGSPKTPMAWILYSGMTEPDLSAIHAYLRTLPPVQHQVVRWTPSGT
jgi:mono/diheme cytochrome c family protein